MPAATLSRRELLAAVAASSLVPAACRNDVAAPPRPPSVAFPLARFPSGVRVTVQVGGHPVEVLRDGTGVTVRSLVCTHQGCEVFWDEQESVYRCPCHDAKYAPDGQVIAGPPPRPLPVRPARIDGERLLVEA